MEGLKPRSSTSEPRHKPSPSTQSHPNTSQRLQQNSSQLWGKKSYERGTTKIKQNRKGEARKTHHKAWPRRRLMAPRLQMWSPNLGVAALKMWVSAPERRTKGGDSASPAPGAASRSATPGQSCWAPPATSSLGCPGDLSQGTGAPVVPLPRVSGTATQHSGEPFG